MIPVPFTDPSFRASAHRSPSGEDLRVACGADLAPVWSRSWRPRTEVPDAGSVTRRVRRRHAGGAVLEATLVLGIVATLIAGTMLIAGARPPAAQGIKAADFGGVGRRAQRCADRGWIARPGRRLHGRLLPGRGSRGPKPSVPNSTTEYSGRYSDGSIYGETFSVFPGGPTPQDFVLGASIRDYWTGGGADCRVDLITVDSKGLRKSLLARTRFEAAS